MHPQIDSRSIASALTTDEEVVVTLQQQSALDMDPQQRLVIQTRDLTLLTPSPSNSNSGTPLGSSPRLAPVAEGGDDATLHHHPERGELASITADVLDAQPTGSPVMGNPAPAGATREETEIRTGMWTAAGQSTTVGLRRSSGVSKSTGETTERPWFPRYEQTSLDYQAARPVVIVTEPRNLLLSLRYRDASNLDGMPNEILTHILSFLDVCDLLATSRTNHHLRALSVHPLLHAHRLRRARATLPPLLTSPSRPTLPELMARRIFQTHTVQVSRRLSRSLAAIRLSRRLPQRPSAESLAQRGVLPTECVGADGGYCYRGGGWTVGGGDGNHGGYGKYGKYGNLGNFWGNRYGNGHGDGNGTWAVALADRGVPGTGTGVMAVAMVDLSPALVARKRAVERERLKDGLRRWVDVVWRGEVRQRSEGVRRREESAGVGRVWRLRRFWERVSSEAA